jgi:hypothetical protein
VKQDFETRFTGGAFAAAALMTWLGWALLPVRIGAFFQPDVFGPIHEQFHLWIWVYRVHLFGRVIAVIAFVALGTMMGGAAARVLIWPGVVVAAGGMFVGMLAEAFYYHHGAWGSIQLAGKSPAEIQAFIDALRVDTEYVTCLTRFGRVFGGVGLVLIAWGLLRQRILPAVLPLVLGLVGLASIALTMGLPDQLSWYEPIFHVLCLWLLTVGIVILWRGIPADASTPS